MQVVQVKKEKASQKVSQKVNQKVKQKKEEKEKQKKEKQRRKRKKRKKTNLFIFVNFVFFSLGVHDFFSLIHSVNNTLFVFYKILV